MAGRYRVIISPLALAQVRSISDYIAAHSQENAVRVVDRLLDEIYSLEEMPGRYALVEQGAGEHPNLRRLPAPPFRVFYEIDPARPVVWILGVEHGARNTGR